jgi:hypothetical protein
MTCGRSFSRGLQQIYSGGAQCLNVPRGWGYFKIEGGGVGVQQLFCKVPSKSRKPAEGWVSQANSLKVKGG